MHSIATNVHATWTTSNFDYQLPPELIAQHPAAQRSSSRLLDGTGAQPVDRKFHDLSGLLNAGDLLVFNDTQVVKARLFGEKSTGGKLELLIERVIQGHEVVAHLKVSKKPKLGGVLHMVGGFTATLIGRWPQDDGPLFRFLLSGDPYQLMQRHGHMPLPPYIERQQSGTLSPTDVADEQEDAQRYQTVFAKHPGAVAAPTAALHFDDTVLAALEAKGVQRASVTLHIGAGTFQPVKAENIAEHVMHFERYAIPDATLQAIADCKARGGKVVAVGTTSVRSLETWAKTGRASGDTNIFITPGFEFKVVDALITNFHLPKSTLMMLVSAFAGYEHIMALYQHAIAQQYRFFSYGDSMLLRKATPTLADLQRRLQGCDTNIVDDPDRF
ncbi:MAG: tRNA preQ1(34) S-adenosylmethionine ribosyltransferase-isomerase QueA [Burkholderiaceae bacterium]